MLDEWRWSERYAAQGEILDYLRHVADRFDLRRLFELGVRVEVATWDETTEVWTITAAGGRSFRARYCIFATGALSAPLLDLIPGRERFAGDVFDTQRWPQEQVSFVDRRVVVIGTGASGVQAVPEIARTAAEVHVLQRTANFSIPGRNRALTDHDRAAERAERATRGRWRRESASCVPFDPGDAQPVASYGDELEAELRRRWALGGAPIFTVAFADLMTDADANAAVAQFVRNQIVEKVDDPKTAALLSPTTHPIGAKRLCVDHGYFEALNLQHVHLHDVRTKSVVKLVEDGVLLADGSVIECDLVVSAVGYDAIAGALGAIDIRGEGGRTLEEHWAERPRTYLGMTIAGFPNLFTVAGPQSPAVLAVMTCLLEQSVEWIDELISTARAAGYATIRTEPAAEENWVAECDRVAAGTLFVGAESFFTGANVPGKARVFPLYAGGMPAYRRACGSVRRDGYRGLRLTEAPSEVAR